MSFDPITYAAVKNIAPGSVKSVQRGTFGAAGTATITPVVVGKTIVLSVSKGSAGTVAATGTVASTTISGSITNGDIITGGSGMSSTSGTQNLSGTIAAAAISGGTTNLTTKQYSAVLTNSTTLTADGACEYQVVEYY